MGADSKIGIGMLELALAGAIGWMLGLVPDGAMRDIFIAVLIGGPLLALWLGV